MRFSHLASLAVPLALAGCTSGQTGSPDCVGATECLCDTLYTAGTLLRVHVDSAEAGHLVAAVDSVFWTVYSDVTWVEVGDRVGGALTGQVPCAGEAVAVPARESDLLVLFSPGNAAGFPNCEEFFACAERDCSELAEPALTDCWAACDSETEQVCSEHRSAALLDGVFTFAVPWSEPLDFGGDRRLTQTELEVLKTPEACLERFPADPPPPCNDVQVGPCSVARPAPATSLAAAMLGLAVLALTAARRLLRSRA
jgi:hypothetical protein